MEDFAASLAHQVAGRDALRAARTLGAEAPGDTGQGSITSRWAGEGASQPLSSLCIYYPPWLPCLSKETSDPAFLATAEVGHESWASLGTGTARLAGLIHHLLGCRALSCGAQSIPRCPTPTPSLSLMHLLGLPQTNSVLEPKKNSKPDRLPVGYFLALPPRTFLV